ncbi:tRNA uridine-5-carboxymethylaminomethyl(34) synthesis GTPase MnmE [Lutimonas zeaxanthinifaciens]|uniref:tRNA uridine-5-carboxymethylaminomethyl(34) synthesis GTPase MnmE n=1 Tax=Lutimonas zeaxanthinifaciens TaxID=3060215 RepID=UPI00265CBE01|nr:tRNA uridine-5-carboxymethylaminomethyl(34) synthesis GTPase MnmE [Lutimonas sp. YSD2104]WKK65081.1 tRNA uridine-5-carboxymethylaminomethyl(34) synthesis GTPase MnmE [Lutimonas sp. YSD2104]
MQKGLSLSNDTIIALATPFGIGAIAVIRLSGPEAIELVSKVFRPRKKGKNLKTVSSHTVHLGFIVDEDRIIDESLVTVFNGPHSYTGENVVEISCHGSAYIQKEILQLLLRSGARHADAGEFTLRAFLNGKMDLSQAEAVADVIASDSKSSHSIAMQQMRGGFSNEIAQLREELLNFASLIELELDFSEEDVEFADRSAFQELINRITLVLKRLIDSFALGNVLKNGIPVAIVGEPNVGKSTLLNALLNEEKAIVSDIAGTTRDAIEDEIVLQGVTYRFIDTAGIRDTKDIVENIGIKKTFENIEKAQLVLHLIDAEKIKDIQGLIREEKNLQEKYPEKKILTLINKADQLTEAKQNEIIKTQPTWILISAKEKTGIDVLLDHLTQLVNTGALSNQQTVVSNSRHFEALNKAYIALNEVQKGMDDNISSDLMAIDIRQALFHLGEITGEITTDDLLGNIFANFCIGK